MPRRRRYASATGSRIFEDASTPRMVRACAATNDEPLYAMPVSSASSAAEGSLMPQPEITLPSAGARCRQRVTMPPRDAAEAGISLQSRAADAAAAA